MALRRRDWDFRNQIERSSRSIASNISEGYGYFRPRQFARYLRIARASTMETRNHILEGQNKHFSSDETEPGSYDSVNESSLASRVS